MQAGNTAAETTTITTSTTTGSLQQILNDMAKQLVAQDAPGLKASALALKEASSSKPQLVMDVLAPLLFQTEAEDNEKDDSLLSASHALQVLAFLVASDESTYLKPASRAVKKTAAAPIINSNIINDFAVSPQLLLTMVAQLSGYDIETSANATEAIVACSRKLGRPFIEPALQAIVSSWKTAMASLTSNRHVASTASVRCATTVTEMVCVLDDTITMTCAIESGAMDLFLTMLKDDSDPLVQMSMLDLVEKMATTRPVHHQRATWLLTPPGTVVEPILKLAGGMQDEDEPDAILGGAALRIVAALCKLAHYRHEQDGTGEGDLQQLMTTTRGDGGGEGLNLIACFHRALHKFAVSGSGEMDRLALVDAISSFAAASPSALDLVLNDDVTKQAWLSLAVAQPHLKTAIVMSVAMVLDPPIVVDANGDSIMTLQQHEQQQQQVRRLDRASAMKLYSSLGQTNHDQDPTSLLLAMTRSTLVETRLGAYAMFQAMAKLPDGAGAQVLFSHASFLDFILTRDHDRETTKQGREGKFAIVQAIAQSQVMGLLAPEIVARIENHLNQGPHYYQARSWELATDQ